MSTPHFELSPATRFADRASDYALFRPSYRTFGCVVERKEASA